MLNKFKKFFYSKILRRKYYRTGQCLGCGRCCKKIYVKHAKGIIQEEKPTNAEYIKPDPEYADDIRKRNCSQGVERFQKIADTEWSLLSLLVRYF